MKAVRRLARNAPDVVRGRILDYEGMRRDISCELQDRDVLEIGPGQVPHRLAYFSLFSKSAVGEDRDVVSTALSLPDVVRMARKNGALRTIKSAGRRLMGVDVVLREEFCRQMNLGRFPDVELKQGDVGKGIAFGDESFDVIYSTDVFEHIADPQFAVQEVRRLLRSGGVALTRTLHWAHANAMHDAKVVHGVKPARWAHLRSSLTSEVEVGAYVNRLRIADWQRLFEENFREVTFWTVPWAQPDKVERELRDARVRGELAGFSDQELLACHLVVRCVKD